MLTFKKGFGPKWISITLKKALNYLEEHQKRICQNKHLTF
jgi:hypothetical protein